MTSAVVAISGATGFIGRALCARMASRPARIRALVRDPQRAAEVLPANVEVVVCDLETASTAELARALAGVGAIVHLAGRAHVHETRATDTDALYQRANVDATTRLAEAALAAGVCRLVFASSIKVNGEATLSGRPFRPDDPPAPADAYARSKFHAEAALARTAQGTAMLPIVLRLPLVYGAHAHGNFRRLVDAIAVHRLLPLGAVRNRRSLLGLDNLSEAIDAALAAPPAVAGVHLIADAEPVSTPELVRAIAAALGVVPRLVSVPVSLLRAAGALAGRSEEVARLVSSLEADTSSFTRVTGWRPRPFAIDAAMLVP